MKNTKKLPLDIELFLIINDYGGIRLTRKFPRMARNEIAVKQRLRIPANSFRSPVIDVDIEVKEGQVIQPKIGIEIEDADNADQE